MEEKYRKAMVSNAQLDNEKNNLMYQVDTLKDSLMELEELLSESQRGYEEKVKVSLSRRRSSGPSGSRLGDELSPVSSQELEREKHAHSVLQFQFTEIKETLKQSEELLNVSIGWVENQLKTAAFVINLSPRGCMTLFTALISCTLQTHVPLFTLLLKLLLLMLFRRSVS